MKCLRCTDVDLEADVGAMHEAVCPRCQGRLLDEASASRVLLDICGLERGLLGELCAHYVGKTQCPACARRMSVVPVRSVQVDLCGGCGALFLDAGELTRLTGGMIDELLHTHPFAADANSGQMPSPPPPSSVASMAAPSPAPPRPAGREASVYLLEPLNADDMPEMVEAWREAGFRTALDARGMMSRMRGGIAADDCSVEEASAVVDALHRRGRIATVVSDSDLNAPPATRTKEIGFGPDGITVADALGRPRSIPTSAIVAIAAARVRVVVTEAPTQASRGEIGEVLTTRRTNRAGMFGRGLERMADMGGPLPVTTMRDHDVDMLDIVAAGERIRVDADGLITRAGGPRSLAELAQRLDQLAPPTAFRQRGVLAMLMGKTPPALKTARDFDREVSWCLWRRLQRE